MIAPEKLLETAKALEPQLQEWRRTLHRHPEVGDMDALPLQEESGEEFSSELPGKMHGCGHDMHTAMVLGAAKLLKEHEDEIEGTVKLEFQPAEEIFQGSLDMINSGLLENPKVDAAVMFHVLAGMPLPAGMVLVPGGGITLASCEQYHIVVHGKGGHGSMPASWTPQALAYSPPAGSRQARLPTSSRILPICGAPSAPWTRSRRSAP